MKIFGDFRKKSRNAITTNRLKISRSSPKTITRDRDRKSQNRIPFLELFSVIHEFVEEMINDVGGEDSDADAVRHFLRFSFHFDVKGEDDGPLGVALQHGRGLHDVALVDRTDADTLERRED